MNDHYVPQQKFDEICSQIPSMEFYEKHRVSHSFWYQNQEFVVTAACSYQHKYKWIQAHRIEDFKSYKGTLIPLSPAKHHHEVDLGLRERGYHGQLALYKGRNIVFCEGYNFKLAEASVQQLSIF